MESKKESVNRRESSIPDRLSSMAREIDAHPDAQLISFAINPGLDDAGLNIVEELLNERFPQRQTKLTLPDPVLSVYRQANGFALRWMHRKSERFDPTTHVYKEGFPKPEDVVWEAQGDLVPDGAIVFLPLERALGHWSSPVVHEFMTDDDQTSFLGVDYPERRFHQQLAIIDAFAHEWAALVLEHPAWPVAHSNHDIADWNHHNPTSFLSYLESILATYGGIVARYLLFVPPGPSRSLVDHDPNALSETFPSLDSILDGLRPLWEYSSSELQAMGAEVQSVTKNL